MIAGTLELQMVANVARLAKDMEQAKNIVGDAAADMGKAIGVLKGILGTLGVSLSAGYFLNWIKGAIETVARMNELASAAGTTASRLSAFELPSRLAGTSLDTVATSIARLGRSIGEARLGDVQKAGVLKALGIDPKDGRDAAEVFIDISKALVSMKDQTIAAAISQQLLGRGFAEMRPLMRQISEQGTLQALVSDDQARAAKRFEDSLRKLAFSFDEHKIKIANTLLPALQEVVDMFGRMEKRGLASLLPLNLAIELAQTAKILERPAEARTGSQADVRRSDLAMGLGSQTVGLSAEDQAKKLFEDRKHFEERVRALQEFAKLYAEETRTGNALLVEALKEGGIDNERTQRQLLLDQQALNDANFQEQKRALQAELALAQRQGDLAKAAEFAGQIAIVNSQIVANDVITQAKIRANQTVSLQKQLEDYRTWVASMEQQGAGLFATQRDVEDRAYRDRLEALDIFLKANEDLQAEGDERRRVLADQHKQNIIAIAQEEWRSRVALAGLTNRELISINDNLFGVLAGLMNTGSRRMFQVGKAASIANAIIKTYEAANNAFATGSAINPFAGYAFMAAAIVAGLANVQKIAQIQFGGGASASSGTSFAPGVGTPVFPGQGSPQPTTPTNATTVQINITGVITQAVKDELLDELRDFFGSDGTLIGPNSRQASVITTGI